MCLGIPGKIIEVLPEPAADAGALPLRRGIVDFGGVRKEVCLSCVDDAGVGDYVIVHVGFAISKVDPDEAARIFEMVAEIDRLGSEPGGGPAGAA